MGHTSSCAYAKTSRSHCQCSCRGTLHGNKNPVFRSSRTTFRRSKISPRYINRKMYLNKLSKVAPVGKNITKGIVSKIAPVVITSTVAATIPATAPAMLTLGVATPVLEKAYSIYKEAQTCEKIYEHLQKNENREAIVEFSRYASSKILENISEPKASEIAQNIRTATEQTGILKTMSEKTGIDTSIYGNMLEAVVKSELMDKVESLKDYVIDETLGN